MKEDLRRILIGKTYKEDGKWFVNISPTHTIGPCDTLSEAFDSARALDVIPTVLWNEQHGHSRMAYTSDGIVVHCRRKHDPV